MATTKKKTTSKKVVKKPAKAAKKKTTNSSKKTAAKKTTGRASDNGGLKGPQVRILKLLAKSSKPLTRLEISEKAPADRAFCGSYIGKVRSDKPGKFKSLIDLRYVKAEDGEVEGQNVPVYSITAAGRKAAAKLS